MQSDTINYGYACAKGDADDYNERYGYNTGRQYKMNLSEVS